MIYTHNLQLPDQYHPTDTTKPPRNTFIECYGQMKKHPDNINIITETNQWKRNTAYRHYINRRKIGHPKGIPLPDEYIAHNPRTINYEFDCKTGRMKRLSIHEGHFTDEFFDYSKTLTTEIYPLDKNYYDSNKKRYNKRIRSGYIIASLTEKALNKIKYELSNQLNTTSKLNKIEYFISGLEKILNYDYEQLLIKV